MSKCPKCGCQCEDGAKFCDECGTPIPQEKECPKCHAHLGLSAKFCDECGFSFENAHGKSSVISMGDKNVVAGDVVAHKASYDIKGNATIVKNEDESKKMVQCSDCGKNIPVSQSFECPSCHRIVCEECFDAASQECKKCIGEKASAKEEAYRAAIVEALSDGKIDVADRKKLMSIQKQLGLTAARAIQLEKEIKSASSVVGESKNTVALDKVNVERAYELVYVKGDYKKAAELLAPIRERNPTDENVLTLYLAALTRFNPVKARNVIESLHADVLPGALALIDIDLKRKALTSVEKRIAEAVAIWPDSVLLKCRKAVYAYEMFKATEDTAPLMEALESVESIVECDDAVERSWKVFAKGLIDSALGEEHEKITQDDCAAKGLLWDIISQNNDKSNALYRIIDLSDGPSANYYPSYYMDTESIFNWTDEFKTDLLVLRRIEPGRFVMGKGLRLLDKRAYDINEHPAHIVTLTHSYYIGVYEVTQRQWELITGDRPSASTDEDGDAMRPVDCIGYEDIRGYGIGAKWPISTMVDSNSFVATLRNKTRIQNIDLPTEAQWEYACRAGTDTDFNDGQDLSDDRGITYEHIAKIACFNRDLDAEHFGSEIVGSYKPNRWGLYDMHGNVAEYCVDASWPHSAGHLNCYGVDPLDMPQVNPLGFPRTQGETVDDAGHGCVRGGTWNDTEPENLTSWAKSYDGGSDNKVGVRLAITFIESDASIEKWCSASDAEIGSMCKEEYVHIASSANNGNLVARLIEAKALYYGTSFFEPHRDRAVRMIKEMADIGYGPAQTFLGAIELGVNNITSALSYLRAAATGGDMAGFALLRMLLRGSPDFVEKVLKYLRSINKDYIYVDERLRLMLPRFKELADKYFCIKADIFPQTVFGAFAPSGDELGCDEDDDAFILFAADGVYVVNGWNARSFNGILTWEDVADRSTVAPQRFSIQLCSKPLVITKHYDWHNDIDVFKKIVALAKEFYKPLLSVMSMEEYDVVLSSNDLGGIPGDEEGEGGVDEEADDEEVGADDDLGGYTVTMSVSGPAFGFGAEKFDDIETLKYIGLPRYKNIDYYDNSISGPILPGSKLSVVATSENGEEETLCFDLAINDTKTGIVYELVDDFCEDIDAVRKCFGDEVCLCGQKKFIQRFTLDYHFDFKGAIDPHKIVVKYAKVTGADGEQICVIIELGYDDDTYSIEAEGKEKVLDFKIWKETSYGASLLGFSDKDFEDTGNDGECDEDEESDEEEGEGGVDEEADDEEVGADDDLGGDTVICKECGGSGKIKCQRCHGAGKKGCDFCHGQGDRVCVKCYGTGVIFKTQGAICSLDDSVVQKAREMLFSDEAYATGVTVDDAIRVYEMLRESAIKDCNAASLGELALFYDADEGSEYSEFGVVECDKGKANELYRIAANGKYSEALRRLGNHYLNDNPSEARRLLELSGEGEKWRNPSPSYREQLKVPLSKDPVSGVVGWQKSFDVPKFVIDENPAENVRKRDEDSTGAIQSSLLCNISNRKRILFLLIGLFAGFVGLHYKYAYRNILYHLTWLSAVAALACFGINQGILGVILVAVWLCLWLGGAVFVKTDGDKDVMKWF